MKKLYGIFLMLMLALVLAACSGGSDDAEGSSESGSEGGENAGTVEIFSWWTGAGEEDGLLALIDLFEKKNPDITIENAAVAYGDATNAIAVLVKRMEGDYPPLTLQDNGGDELNEGWVAAEKMETLNDLYEVNGWKKKFPEELIDLVSIDGNIYSVPVNIHRG